MRGKRAFEDDKWRFSKLTNYQVPCLASAGSSVGCSSDDQACQCSSSAAIQIGAAPCVIASCTAPLDVLNAANSLCACVKANPTTPCSTSASVTSTSSTSKYSTYKFPSFRLEFGDIIENRICFVLVCLVTAIGWGNS
jgi:hypothetical protein